MLERLILENIGPAPRLALDPLAPRLNIITGDNGLGKTLLLDAAWYALTDSFANGPILPAQEAGSAPIIAGSVLNASGTSEPFSSKFQYDIFSFSGGYGHASSPVIYARVDGGFSILDPLRERTETDARRLKSWEEPGVFNFSRSEVFDGLTKGERVVCNGLIRDWTSWQKALEPPFAMLNRALTVLSPPEGEAIVPGRPTRVRVDDARDYPTLRTAAGDVPITQVSAGYRRIISLAYLLAWTWHEHLLAARLRRKEPSAGAIFLIDEVDVHLHPRWQRTILGSILQVMSALSENEGFQVQVIANTHAPLVLASLETAFNEATDALWDLDMVDGVVQIRREEWRSRGDVNKWLTSTLFDLKEPRSKEAEEALCRAKALMRSSQPDPKSIAETQVALEMALMDTDTFWVRWDAFRENVGNKP